MLFRIAPSIVPNEELMSIKLTVAHMMFLHRVVLLGGGGVGAGGCVDVALGQLLTNFDQVQECNTQQGFEDFRLSR